MSTRPRIEFDQQGICNACKWTKEKSNSVDWRRREKELVSLLNNHKNADSGFDCIVPVSGGKDGSYVTLQMVERYKMRPLCVTVRPPLELGIGLSNLASFVSGGYDHIHISPNKEAMRVLDTIGFTEYGQGYYGWLIAIHSAVLKIAHQFGVSLIMYAEDGEIEYGGSTATKHQACYGYERMKEVYLSDTYNDVVSKANLPAKDLYWFTFDNEASNIEATHFSYFEPWDPYRNYIVAKEKAGLMEAGEGNTGTFTNFAQNDQELASLHYYLMYLKFGFGRATQDAGIEIRRGAMSREQAIHLVRIFDNQPPTASYEKFADYFRLSVGKFEQVLEKFVNKDLFTSDGKGNVRPLYEIY
jgi:N-acetyl sugar amidotransferase